MVTQTDEVVPAGSPVTGLDFAALVLRFGLGIIFFGHALQKLGWFKGGGYPTDIDSQADMVEFFGYSHTQLMAWLVTLTEAFSGALLLLGLFTPLAVAGAIGITWQFLGGLQWSAGLFGNDSMGGYEQTLGGFVGVAALGFIGAGRFSLDAILPIPSWLRGWRAGVAAVVLGLVVGTIVMIVFGNGLGGHAPF